MVVVTSWQDDVRERLRGVRPGREAQLRLCPRPRLRSWDPGLTPDGARQAGALILLYPGPEGPSLVLTERRSDLPHHPGQISLPGGGVDAGETPQQAALREAHEEVGVDPASVEVVGTLSTLWVVMSGFVVHPVVGIAQERPVFTPSPREVASVLEVPLARLSGQGGVGWARRHRDGLTILCPYFVIDGPPVWGATAMMLGELCAVLNPDFDMPAEPTPDMHEGLLLLK